MHFPHALPPLAGEYTCRAIAPGLSYRWERAGVPLRMTCRVIHGYAYFTDRLLVDKAELPAVMAKAEAHRRARIAVTRRYWEEEVLPTLHRTYAWMRELPVETAPLGEIANAWDDFWRRFPRLWGMHFMTNAGSYQSLNDLADFYETVIDHPHPGEALLLTQGTPHELHRVEQDLFHLAETARAVPAVAEPIARDPDSALLALATMTEAVGFLRALRAFLAQHGHLGQPFDDITFASWADEPERLLAEVRKRLLHPAEDPAARAARLGREAEAAVERVRARLRDRPAERERFEELLARAREVGPLTEDHNYWLDRMLQAHVHRLCIRVGARLAAAEVLAQPADIFFLYVQEIADALRAPAELSAQVAQRRAEHQQWSQVRPPKYLGAMPEPTGTGRFDAPAPEQTEEALLRGRGAAAGVGRGPARVVLDPEDFARVESGDILVCPAANPSWVPLFGIIGGLVTDTGGVLSHAAVVAREFGVPAVVGTGVATQRIRDGQIIEVNGTQGEVRLR